MEQLTEFNNGGSHQENPNNGIPQGVNSNGQPNLVEEGETKLNVANYIFSDRLKLDKEIATIFNLDKFVGKTFAEISKELNNSKSRRENDSIEQNATEKSLNTLMEAQEEFKAKELAKDIAKMEEKHPDFMKSLQQPVQQQAPEITQEQAPNTEQISSPIAEQPIDPNAQTFEDGGNLNSNVQQNAASEEQGSNIYDSVVGGVTTAFPIVGGAIGLGDMIGKPIKNSAEKTNEDGTFKNDNNVTGGYVAATMFNPAKTAIDALTDKNASTGEKVLGGLNLLIPGIGAFGAKGYTRRKENANKIAAANQNTDSSAIQEQAATETYYADGGYLEDDPIKRKKYSSKLGLAEDTDPIIEKPAPILTAPKQVFGFDNPSVSLGSKFKNTYSFSSYDINTEASASTPSNTSASLDEEMLIDEKSQEIATEEAKANTFGDGSLEDQNLDFSTKQTLANAVGTYAPVAYNLGRGLFGKADKRKLKDYYEPLNPIELNIDPALRDTEQTFAAGQNALRNSGRGSSYLAIMKQLSDSRNKAFANLHATKENADNQNKYQTDSFNIQNKLNARIGIDDYNARSQAAKEAFTQEGIKQVSDISQSDTQNKLAMSYNSMFAPDFAKSATYSTVTDRSLKWLEEYRKRKLAKNKETKEE